MMGEKGNGETLNAVWDSQGWETPVVEEQYNPDRTILTLSFIEKQAEKTSRKNKQKKQAEKTSRKNKQKKQAEKTSRKNKQKK